MGALRDINLERISLYTNNLGRCEMPQQEHTHFAFGTCIPKYTDSDISCSRGIRVPHGNALRRAAAPVPWAVECHAALRYSGSAPHMPRVLRYVIPLPFLLQEVTPASTIFGVAVPVHMPKRRCNRRLPWSWIIDPGFMAEKTESKRKGVQDWSNISPAPATASTVALLMHIGSSRDFLLALVPDGQMGSKLERPFNADYHACDVSVGAGKAVSTRVLTMMWLQPATHADSRLCAEFP